ncbi:hypothetical protein ACFVX3_31785 [Rhodococcus erythropolis]
MTEHFYLPTNERQGLVKVLGEVPETVENLARCMTVGIRAQTFQPKVSTGEQPQPLPFNPDAGEMAESLRQELRRWVVWLCDIRGLTQPGHDVLPLARWLARNILLLAVTPGSETAYTSISAKVKAAQRSSGRTPASSIVHVVDVAQARNRLLNATGCAVLAKEIGIEGLTRVRVNTLHYGGHIEPVKQSGRVLIYRLGDVLDAHETVITWKPKPKKKTKRSRGETNQSSKTDKR